MAILWHWTRTQEVAEAILRDGFTDGEGTYLTAQRWSGVWLADTPDAFSADYKGPLLRVTLHLPESTLHNYEWVEEGRGHREWLIPATVVNQHSCVEVVEY
jgi:hypothetical protein